MVEVVRQNKVIAWVLGGLIVMALLVLLLNDDPEPRPGVLFADLTPAATSGAGTTAPSPPLRVTLCSDQTCGR